MGRKWEGGALLQSQHIIATNRVVGLMRKRSIRIGRSTDVRGTMSEKLEGLLSRPMGHADGDVDEIKGLSVELGRLQRALRVAGVPVLILFEGWEAAGKGTLINRVALTMDPRGYRVLTVQSATDEENLRPPLYRFWRDLPTPGQIILCDRSWYDRIWRALANGEIRKRELSESCEDIRAFERTLADQGYLVLKFFLQISKKEQGRRFDKLQKRRSTAWRIDATDLIQHAKYRKWKHAIEHVMAETAGTATPFHIVNAKSRQLATLAVFREIRRIFIEHLREVASRAATPAAQNPPEPKPLEQNPNAWCSASPATAFHADMPVLSQIDLTQRMDISDYDRRIDELKKELRNLEHRIFTKRIGVVVLVEGWDAAGKGGSIRRLVSALDPRGYEVIPIAAPTPLESRMHFLWRFAQRLPKGGHIAIFDRTWYGRVLVERVEGFCSTAKWRLAYDEINAFENHLARSGNVLVKLWFQIDQAEQLRRFEARQQDPDKSWKITAEDWRNRERWPEYEVAVEEMIQRTSTSRCPWTVIAANDKPFARITALQTVARAIASRLDQ